MYAKKKQLTIFLFKFMLQDQILKILSDSETAQTEHSISKISRYAKNVLQMMKRNNIVVVYGQRKGPDIYFRVQQEKLPEKWVTYIQSIPIDYSSFNNKVNAHKIDKPSTAPHKKPRQELPDTFL